MGANKAVWGTVVAALAAFCTALLTVWTDTDPLTVRDFLVAAVAALTSGGVTGATVYQVTNRG